MGSIVRLEVPQTSYATGMKAGVSLSARERQPHILVVDNDPLMREMISDYLLESDQRVSTAPGGADMECILKEHVVDLVLLELKLKGEDGIDLSTSRSPGCAARSVATTSRSKSSGPSAG